MLVAFAIWELRSDHPMLDVTFFENPRFTAANISIVLVFFALFGSLFFLTQYLQFVLGYTPLQAGHPRGAARARPDGRRADRRPAHRPVREQGPGRGGDGDRRRRASWYMGTLTVTSGYGHVVISLLILGLGMGTAMVPATESIMGSLPLAKAGVGSAMNDTTRQIGGALGVAILGSIFASSYATHIVSSLRGLPESSIAAAQNSVGAALAIGEKIGGTQGAAIISGREELVHQRHGSRAGRGSGHRAAGCPRRPDLAAEPGGRGRRDRAARPAP